jgi:hypothetical protein
MSWRARAWRQRRNSCRRRWKRRRCRWRTSRGLASVDIQGRVQLAIPSFFGKGRKGPSDGYRFRSTRPTGCPLTRKDRGLTPAVARRACMRAFSWLWSHFDRGMGKQALNGCSGGGRRRLEPLDWLRRGAQARAACQMRFRLLPCSLRPVRSRLQRRKPRGG